MREVKLSDGKKIEVRPMTRREIREGKTFGFQYLGFNITRENFDEACDYALEMQFGVEKLNDLNNPDQLLLFGGILKETYPDKEEEKNLSKSGQNDQTNSEQSTARPAS